MDIVPSASDMYTDVIKINQLGYLPDQNKTGIVSFESGASTLTPTTFQIITDPGGTVVHTGSLSYQTAESSDWGQDNDDVYHADFTSFDTPGDYKMVVAELNQTSQPFSIRDDIYDDLFRDALRFYYFARSGEACVEPFAEGHTRQSFYETETLAPYMSNSGTRDVLGGWFDAGDLHKDIHAQTETMWFLLETLKEFQNKNGAQNLNIPESDANISDLFYLIKFNLDWMAKMWNSDGSVHFWVEYDGFPGTIGEVSEVSSGSASTLAAVFAKAYPLYKAEPGFSDYADSLLFMAETSWNWLDANPLRIEPINVHSGQEFAYAFSEDEDDANRAFAAVELFNATGNASYNTYFTSRFSDPLSDYYNNQGWGGIIKDLDHSDINFAYLDYANSPQANASLSIQNELKAVFITQADWTIERIGYTPYNIPLIASNHLWWGSSATIVTHAYIYNQAYLWTNDLKYKNAIPNCMDWIMGRNPVNRILVSGYGDALHGTDIYSFYWTDVFNSPPGYLTGNINAADNSLAPYFKDPWKQYLNIQQASMLEPGIYWNAMFAWLAGYMASDNSVLTMTQPLEGESLDLEVFPSPVSNVLHIKNPNSTVFNVFNITGEHVLSSLDTSIDVSELDPGAYFLVSSSKSVKFIKN